MGLFDIFKRANINDNLEDYRNTKGSCLIDVREPAEFKRGHIPGSKNVPLSSTGRIKKVAKSKSTPLFVYCASGMRSRQAVAVFKSMGYEDAVNIGGIARYRGPLER